MGRTSTTRWLAVARIVVLGASLSFGHAAEGWTDGPASVVDRFVQAWNGHDMDAFATVFTDNASWVPVAEQRLEGRTSIVADLRRAHESWAKTVTLAVSDSPVVRLLRPDVAVILCHIGYPNKDGKLSSPGNALMIIAVRQSNEWRITAGQITKPKPGEAPR